MSGLPETKTVSQDEVFLEGAISLVTGVTEISVVFSRPSRKVVPRSTTGRIPLHKHKWDGELTEPD